MNQSIITQELKKLESEERTRILYDFLESQQGADEALSDLLLDVIHAAFVSGFETAITSVISSFDKKTIE